MMGEVITARGSRLNMDELKLKAKRPLVQMGDQKDKVRPQQRPVSYPAVRGFVPAMEGVARQPINIAPSAQQPVVQEVVDGPSMADYTGITVERLKHLDDRPENPTETANQTLREIMGDLDQMKTREPAPQTKTRRKS